MQCAYVLVDYAMYHKLPHNSITVVRLVDIISCVKMGSRCRNYCKLVVELELKLGRSSLDAQQFIVVLKQVDCQAPALYVLNSVVQ